MKDSSQAGPLDLGEHPPSVMDVVLALDQAGRDPRVKGVFIRLGSAGLSVPRAEEIAAALKRFRATGKFVVAHSQGFNSTGLGDYLAATGADEIWMQPHKRIQCRRCGLRRDFPARAFRQDSMRCRRSPSAPTSRAPPTCTWRRAIPARTACRRPRFCSHGMTMRPGIAADRKLDPAKRSSLRYRGQPAIRRRGAAREAGRPIWATTTKRRTPRRRAPATAQGRNAGGYTGNGDAGIHRFGGNGASR